MRHKIKSDTSVLFLLLQASFCLVYGNSPLRTFDHLDHSTGEPNASKEPSKQVIESFHVQTDIRYRFATTKMCSVVRNTAGIAREIAFGVTLPKGAFIVSFAMTIDGKVYDGEVKEKMAAKEQYHQAVQKGQSAGHIRQTPRHSNRFDMSVNIANGTAVNFTLIYQQILSRRIGIYEYEMHVEPGQAVNDFNVEVFIQENRPLLFVKTPQIRKASIDDNSIVAPSKLTTVDRPSKTTAHIQYNPTVRQQGKDGLAARFVVQYDIEHADKGDVLVADGYFIHLFSPKPRSPLPKDIIFVLDVSGSMSGTKISQLIDAMKTILDDLTEEDRFNILTFSNTVSKWKRVLSTVTSQIIEEAKQYVNQMIANGGTNINDALLNALSELQGREVQSRAGMIFFLTDGEATVGETNPASIAKNVKNENVDQTSIYSLAFGQGANFESLKTISTGNYGYARKIYEASDAALQVESLYDEISTVVMKNVTVKYLPGVTKTTQTVFPIVHNGTEIFVGGCIFDLGVPFRHDEFMLNRHRAYNSTVFQAEIKGTEKEGEVNIILEIDDIEDITIDPDDSLNSFFTMPRDYTGIVEKMWAFLTIKQMLTEKQAVIEDRDKVEELRKKILDMSLKYKFVTPLTSMVVTQPDMSRPVESGLEDSDTPLRPMHSLSKRPMSTGRASRPRHSLSKRPMSSGRANQFPMRAFPQPRPLFPATQHLNNPGIGHSFMKGHRGVVPSSVMTNSFDYGGTVVSPKLNSRRQKSKISNTFSRKKVGGRAQIKKKRAKNTAAVGVLRSLVFRTNETSMCLQPKRIPNGKYLLAQANSPNSFKVELITGCLRKCRIVVPESLDLTSDGKTTRVNLTSLDSWAYKQHADFDVTFVKMNEMVLEHDNVTVSLVRSQKGKKMFFSILLQLKISPVSVSSAMTDIMLKYKGGKKRRPRKMPKLCLKANTDFSTYLMKRKALKYKV